MIKLNVILFSLLAPVFVWSQHFLPAHYDTTRNHGRIELSAGAFYHTSSLENELSQKFIRGGHITDEIKDRSKNKHQLFNSLGGEIESEITYIHGGEPYSDSSSFSWLARGGRSIQFAGAYSDDFYDLLFYGNADKIDQRINVSNTRGFLVDSYKVGAGIYHKKSKSSVVLNAVFINDYLQLNSGNNNILTSSSTGITEVRADVLFDQAASHTTFQGIGASLDFDYYLPIRTEGLLDGFVQITGRNLGAGYITKNQRTDVFGNYRFEGFAFDDLIDFRENSDLISNIEDSLNITTTTGGKWIALPGIVQIGKIVDNMSEKDIQFFFGARGYINRVFRPMVYFGSQYKLIDQMNIGGQISYGGYGGLRGGIYANYQMDKASIALGTEDVLGAVSQRFFGQSIVLRLNYLL